jgi:hypothetical protein
MRLEEKVPRRTYILFALLTALSIFDFAESWEWGLHYQGAQFTAVICSIHVAWIGFLTIAFRRCLKNAPAFGTSLFFNGCSSRGYPGVLFRGSVNYRERQTPG